MVRNLCGWFVYPSRGDSMIMTVDCQTAVRCAVTDRTVISLFILDDDYCLYSGQLRSWVIYWTWWITAVRCVITDRTVISLFIPDNDYCLYSGQLRSRQSTGPDGLICNASWVTGDSCLICFINKPSVYFNSYGFWFD